MCVKFMFLLALLNFLLKAEIRFNMNDYNIITSLFLLSFFLLSGVCFYKLLHHVNHATFMFSFPCTLLILGLML